MTKTDTIPIPGAKPAVSAVSKTVRVKGKLRDVALDSDCPVKAYEKLPKGWYWLTTLCLQSHMIETNKARVRYADWCYDEARRVAKSKNTDAGVLLTKTARGAMCQVIVKGEYLVENGGEK